MQYELSFSEGEYREYTQICIRDEEGQEAYVQVGPVPFCCGATMICGISSDWDTDVEYVEKMVWEVLTDYDYWLEYSCYFCWTEDREKQVGGLLCRSKLMFVDCVGGEDEDVPSLSRMAEEHGKFEMVGKPTKNANSGHMIATYEYRQKGHCQI